MKYFKVSPHTFAIHAGTNVSIWQEILGCKISHIKFGQGSIIRVGLKPPSNDIFVEVSFIEDSRKFWIKDLWKETEIYDLIMPSSSYEKALKKIKIEEEKRKVADEERTRREQEERILAEQRIKAEQKERTRREQEERRIEELRIKAEQEERDRRAAEKLRGHLTINRLVKTIDLSSNQSHMCVWYTRHIASRK